MKGGDVRIEEMTLRIDGLTREQGRHLGETVAKRLVEMKVPRADRRIPSLALELHSTTDSIERLADEIVLGIQRNLK
jgi:hypothetical protein